jgi:1-deoxy-D-xylulose-5-phosphate reductoisomerase
LILFLSEKMKKRIAILGSTGSIGTQALEVIASHPDFFSAEILFANRNADLLIEQCMTFKPHMAIIGQPELFDKVNRALAPHHINVFAGTESLVQCMSMDIVDMVLAAMMGYAGLLPVTEALKHGIPVAIANKETLVVAGELITRMAAENKAAILPVDSEHSAIFQCLQGERFNPIRRIILTASGGPFRGKDRTFLETVTSQQALKHPNWSMGNKITIDSATLMNKGLEMIEAQWLFGLQPEQIEVIVHPQSIIHSMVEFEDGSIKAQMGLPDMKLPIQYALAYPQRLSPGFTAFDFSACPQLTFEKPDEQTFRCLSIARQAMITGGTAPCIMNAANEIAVDAFLKAQIRFTRIPEVIEHCLEKITPEKASSIADYQRYDRESREKALQFIQHKSIISPVK